MCNSNSWISYTPSEETVVTVTERVFDEKGNVVKETVTVTKKAPRDYNPYPYQVTY